MRRHPFDPVSLVFGLAFAAVGLAFALGDVTLASLDPSLLWIAPTLFVGITALLVGIGRLRGSGDREVPRDEAPTDPDGDSSSGVT